VAFGSPRRARIIAAALDDAGGFVQQLFVKLENDLEGLGILREERAFRPHVTLARIKRPGDVRDWLDAAALSTDSVELRELVLFRSILGPDGSTYLRLAEAELGRG
jgi:2'-5' RNA ligase